MAREVPENKPTPPARPTHDEITRRAYEIFIERGQPHGRDMDHWLEAEAQLVAALQPKKQSSAGAMRRRTSPARSSGRRT